MRRLTIISNLSGFPYNELLHIAAGIVSLLKQAKTSCGPMPETDVVPPRA